MGENVTLADWHTVARQLLLARCIDRVEEEVLYPQKEIAYQFSSRGHALAQILLGQLLTNPKDGVGAYYRSRPLLLSLGLTIEEAIASPMAKAGGYSDGRDIGVVCNLPSRGKATVLPMGGDVGSQYTPAAGWAQGIQLVSELDRSVEASKAIVAVLGGEGSVATNGFWSALTMATTLSLPMLFFIEDNGYAISVPSFKQTPGGNIAKNLESFTNLAIDDGDGTDPVDAATRIRNAVSFVRSERRPYLLRLKVPRLSGHSGQDTQAYKPQALLSQEIAEDPYSKLKQLLVPSILTREIWDSLEREVESEVESALEKARSFEEPTANPTTFLFSAHEARQAVGGNKTHTQFKEEPFEEGARINLVDAVRLTLKSELARTREVLVFGEDVGAKGGVHSATRDLQKEFGETRVFDTSLSEEGIIGRAEGLALKGFIPIPEIQFRKYADPATERINNIGTMRWRTANKFAAPMVVRVAGGFTKKVGDPWHSVSGEAIWAHTLGWQVAMPSNAADAVGLLRYAIYDNNPTFFFEHRALIDSAWARRPYPGDDYVIPFGKAATILEGTDLTVVSWGAMVERSEEAIKSLGASVELIDLRTICPWDKQTVLESVKKTKRLMIVHEDTRTAGFGAEISAVVAEEVFLHLDAPITRVTTPDVPIPYNVGLMNQVVPTTKIIAKKIEELLSF